VAPVARLLTETDVYVKYGLHKKALDHVQKILADDAENPDALERIRDIRDAMGDRAGAVEAADRVVRSLIARGEEGRIDKAIERLRQLDPALAEVALERVTAPPEAGTPASSGLEELPPPDGEPARRIGEAGAPAPESSAPEEIAPAIPVEPEADFVPLDIVAAESEFEAPPAQGPRGDLGPAPVVDDERAGLVLDDEVHSREVPLTPTEPEPALVLEDGAGLEPLPAAGEGAAAAPALPEVEIPPLELEEAAAAEAAGPGSVQPQEVDLSDVEEIEADEVLPETPPAAPPPLPERGPPALDAELEEVEFYERHGLLEEALLAVRELEAAHPGHPVVEEARSRIERLAGLDTGAGVPGEEGLEAAVEGAPDRPPPDAEPGRITLTPDAYASTGTTGIFDLGAELSAELGPDLTPTPTGEFQYSVADVFDQFKRGLEKTVRPDDSATKYDLGIAFQEMGMLDEALEQFRSALAGGDRRREVEILDMIGICLGLKGEHREAVETFRRALQSEFLTGDGAKAVHFELGVAHEALGEPEIALWYYQKIAQGDPGYRGAGERVVRLGGGPGTAPDDAGHPSPGSKAEATDAGGAEPRRHTTRKNAGSR
jgi:tetratricopeptide (TPR) repeat protein